MGRGDKKTKRGKIFRGTFGKARPKPKKFKTKKNKEESSKNKEDKE